MAKKWFKRGGHHLRLFSKRRKSAGFTLIELLVAMVIASIITSVLLFLVVQLLQTSQRESARSDTQREMQMALDYIGRDLREAVYVYDGPGLLSKATYLPAALKEGTNLPVLAFWRVDPLPPKVDKICTDNAAVYTTPNAASIAAIGIIPCVSRRMYTLVVYSLNWDAGSPWSGKARIKRYQLPQYTYGATTNAATPGWLFPAGGDVSFMSWPLDAKGVDTRTNQTPPPDTQVLVDFVDKQGLSVTATDAVCPAVPTTDPVMPGYILTPSSATNRGFYVCVKGAESNGNLNQEVFISLQGNAAGRPGLPIDKSNVPISMQTRVMTRGSLDKRI